MVSCWWELGNSTFNPGSPHRNWRSQFSSGHLIGGLPSALAVHNHTLRPSGAEPSSTSDVGKWSALVQVLEFVLYTVLVALIAASGLVAFASEDEKQRRDARRVLTVCLGTLTAALAAPELAPVVGAWLLP